MTTNRPNEAERSREAFDDLRAQIESCGRSRHVSLVRSPQPQFKCLPRLL
jgi:hypothetical protein